MTTDIRFDEEFQVISSEKENIINLKHKLCGLQFEVNTLENLKKVKCPLCSSENMNSTLVLKQINELYNKEYKILDYNNQNNSILLKHKECGNTISYNLDYILKNKPKHLCKNITCKKNTTQKRIELLLGEEFEMLDEYKGLKKKNLIKHKKCNNIFEISISQFEKRTNKCLKCAQDEQRKEFNTKFYEKLSDEYEVIGEFINKNRPINIKHKTCGKILSIKPSKLLNLKTKNICTNQNCTHIVNKEKINSKLDKDYKILNEILYKNQDIKILHNTCNQTFDINIQKVLKSNKINCPNCDINNKTEMFKEKLYNIHNDNYELLEDIADYKKIVNFKHNKCGNVFKATPLMMINPTAKNFCTNDKCKIEQINNDLIKYTKGDFEVIDFEKDNANNLSISHTKCNKIFSVNMNYLKKYKKLSCPHCKKQEHRNKQILEIKKILGEEYEILSEYQGYYSPIEIKHKVCGTITKIKPKNIKNKDRINAYCQNYKCRNNEYVSQPLPEEYILIEGDINKIYSKIKLKHKKCGYEFETTYKSFISKLGIKCDKCNLKDKEEKFKEKLKKYHNNEFELVGKFKGVEKRTLFKHNKCGTVFELIPNDFFRRDKKLCPLSECGWTQRTLFVRIETASLKNYLERKMNYEYEILEIIDKKELLLKVKHKSCSNVFEVKYSSFIRRKNEKCPQCNTKTEIGKIRDTIRNMYENEFIVLEINNITKFNKLIKLQHKQCENTFLTTTEDLINGKTKCSNKNCNNNYINNKIIKNSMQNQKKLQIENKLNNEFIISDKYNGNNYILTEVTHKKCGHTQLITIDNLLKRKEYLKCDECSRKKKEEIFKNKIKDKYILLSEYHNRNTNIKVKRIECGHIYETKVGYVLNDEKYICPKCKIENKIKYINKLLSKNKYNDFQLLKYTDDKNITLKHLSCDTTKKITLKSIQNAQVTCKTCNEDKKLNNFKNKVFNLVGNEYEVISTTYKNIKTPIKIKHKKCGHIHDYIPNNFLINNVRCPKCSKTLRWNTKMYQNELYSLTKGEFLLKSEYVNSTTNVTIKHTKCNKIFNTKPGRFLKKIKCPHCSTNSQKLSDSEYSKRFNSVHKGRLDLLSKYKSMNKNVTVLHKECGKIFEDNARRFLMSKHSIICPKCNMIIEDYDNSRKAKFEKKLYDKFNGEYILVSEYKGIKNKVDIKHKKCGNIYSRNAESILQSKSPCKDCKKK